MRFGFELIEYFASLYNCEIEIVDHTEKTEQQELVEDLIQIITVFSCKLQGKRANKEKKLVQELLQEELNDKSSESNVILCAISHPKHSSLTLPLAKVYCRVELSNYLSVPFSSNLHHRLGKLSLHGYCLCFYLHFFMFLCH